MPLTVPVCVKGGRERVCGLLCHAWMYILLMSAAVAVQFPLLSSHQSSTVCSLDRRLVD
jgi:hypothetical protein